MSAENLTRRARADISFQGVDISKNIKPYFLSLSCTDNEDSEADDLELTLQDREQIWQESWRWGMGKAPPRGGG